MFKKFSKKFVWGSILGSIIFLAYPLKGNADPPKGTQFLIFKLPLEADHYSEMIQPLFKARIMEKFGEEEWRLIVLTHEVHGHVGIYTLLGTKMGLYARELFNAPWGGLVVISEAGYKIPLACLTDGVGIGTGTTLGKGNLLKTNPNLGENTFGNPAAQFYYQGKYLRLVLKKEVVKEVAARIKKASDEFGFQSPRYYQEVDKMAIWSWAEHDRRNIFEVQWLN